MRRTTRTVTNLQYQRQHRAAWENLGIVTTTMKIPEIYREELLCIAEVMRAEHMVALAEREDTPAAVITTLSERNVPKMAAVSVFETYHEAFAGTTQQQAADDVFETFTKTVRKAENARELASEEEDADLSKLYWAQAVAYRTLCVALGRDLRRMYDIALEEIHAKKTVARAMEAAKHDADQRKRFAEDEKFAESEDLAKLMAAKDEKGVFE